MAAIATLPRCTLLFLLLSVCSCQRDCTGVDCPQLDNCIEEVLESGACCASCLQKGCTCEGYQYYDCLNAGFKNGKVPAGDSYFVDYGSTECSCPTGGGRISCHFISCPDIPPNCIEVSEPADGCMQCERVGCVHDGQKYEAGHSFHIDSCRVCHCPNEGGELMCYPVPDCDPEMVQKPMLAAPVGEDSRGSSYPYKFDQQGRVDQATPYRLPLTNPSENLPLFKLDDEEPEEYDYGPTDFPETYPQSLVFPTQSSSSSPSSPYKFISVSRGSNRPDKTSTLQSSGRPNKLELRERYGVHDHPKDGEEVTESPPRAEQSTVRTHMHKDATTSWQPSQHLTSITFSDHTTQTDSQNPLHALKSLDSVIFPLNRGLGSEKHPEYPHVIPESTAHHHRGLESKTHQQNLSESVTPRSSVSHSNISHPMRDTDSQTDQERRSGRIHFPLLKGPESPIHPQARSHDQTDLQGTVTPDREEEVDEEEVEEKREEIVTFHGVTVSEGGDVPYKVKPAQEERSHQESESSNPTTSYKKTTPEPSTSSPRRPEYLTTPTVRFITTTTTQAPVRVRLDESEPGSKQGQELLNLHREEQEEVKEKVTEEEEEQRSARPVLLIQPEEGPGSSAEDLLQSCCASGQKWATENQHCNHMPLLNPDSNSICSITAKQCCLSSVKDSQCESGMISARGGDTCEVDKEKPCTDDSYQVCCSCCALGLRVRSEGQGCDAHQYLGYPCGHIFLTCCEEDEGPSQFPLRRKQMPRPTSLPKKVSDSKFPKEAFSISATDEAANAVEELEDVDECQLYLGQLCQHTCTNTWGSYRCGCHQGYILQEDGHSCAPVSPEEDNRVKEDSLAVVPTQTTTTTTTTSTTTSSPVHLNPCAENGPCSQQCTVVAGRARCSCFPGFSLMTDVRMCEDVDECATNTHSCRPSEHCVNTVGSFVCELQVTCPAGYQLRNGVCKDIDECVLRTHNCGMGFVCENTPGSFQCNPKNKCISGFTQDSHGNCIDINECSSLSEPCSSGFNCINTVGSYTCQKKVIMCSHGYQASQDGVKCVDIDECQMGTHRCGVGQICHNLPGSYRCDCQTGYQYDALRKVCTDVNECWRYPGRLCAQTCENTPGSYHCSCTAGFSLAFDGKNCEDINECDKNPCSQECANIYGSYQCYCRQGFFLKEDGHTCEDIDECSQSIGNLCTFQCVNVAGSYQCSCPPHGYVMAANGRTCRDIDECKTGSHNCSFGQSCYNLQGGFRCLSFNCPPNYKKVSDTRCERVSCPTNALDCQNSPARITYYQLSFQTNIIIPAQIFRIGPSPAYSGDHIVISIIKGNEEGYFSTRKLNSFTGAVYLQRQVREPKDFLIDVEMKLLRQGTFTSFVARIYVFITSSIM